MTHPAFSLPPDDALEALVNEVVDAECAGRDALALSLIRKGVSEFPGFGARLAATRAAVKKLRQPVFVPDQRPEVLVEVDYVRPFLSPRIRRQISASRVAIAAGIVLTASVITVFQHVYPQITPEGSGPTPIGGVVEASRADATASVQSLATAVVDLRRGMTAPVSSLLGRARPEMLELNDGPLTLGSMAKYDVDLEVSSGPRLTPSPSQFRPYRVAIQDRAGDPSSTVPSEVLAWGGPANSGGLRYDDGPVVLLSGAGANASVQPLPLMNLHVDADGVVLFGASPPPAKDTFDGLRR